MASVLQEKIPIEPKLSPKAIRDIREYKVIKANSLIQKSQHNLSAQEQKIVLYLITKIKPSDTEIKTYEFKIKEFCQICGIGYESGQNYSNLKKTIKSLADKSFWADINNQDEEDEEALCRWIEDPVINKKRGVITLKLHKRMKPYLIQLKQRFTQYSLYYTLAMKSRYSISLYEILKSYENLHEWKFDIEPLKEMLSVPKYYNFSSIKKRVFDVAIKEINNLGDINVKYRLEKDGRKFSAVIFEISTKSDFKERAKTWARIDSVISPSSSTVFDHVYNEEVE